MTSRKDTSKSILTSVLPDSIEHAAARLKKVEPVLAERFLLSEIDGPRLEICSCYVIGAFTSCITLTSHLLERYCKELLITVEFGKSFLRFIAAKTGAPPDLAKYLGKDLSATLSACKTKGLLSKQDWKALDKYRDILRNGFGHYDPAKILQGQSITYSTIRVDNNGTEEKEIRIQDTSLAHYAVDVVAEANAWPYLVTVENFIRSTIRHFYNPDINPDLTLIPLE